MSHTIEFFFDIASAYSYLASTQIEDLGKRCNANIRWRPFLLGGVFKATGNTMPASVPAKAKALLVDLKRWTTQYNIPFSFPSRFPPNSIPTQRALIAAGRLFGESAIPRFSHALFHAYWSGDDRDISDKNEIRSIAEQAQLDDEAIIKAIDEPETKNELRAVTEEAVSRGAFGAPTFFVGEKMFWGNDRFHFLEKAVTQE